MTASPPLPAAEADAFFGALFQRELSYVYRSVQRLGVPERDAQDVTHDVFVVVHRKLASYDRARPLRPWLLAIAARVAADYRRLSRNRLEQVGITTQPADGGLSQDARLEQRDARALLLEALQAVDEERRPLLIMVDLDEVNVTEAARALELPLNTAYSRLRLAREELTAAVRRLAARGGKR